MGPEITEIPFQIEEKINVFEQIYRTRPDSHLPKPKVLSVEPKKVPLRKRDDTERDALLKKLNQLRTTKLTNWFLNNAGSILTLPSKQEIVIQRDRSLEAHMHELIKKEQFIGFAYMHHGSKILIAISQSSGPLFARDCFWEGVIL